MATRAGLDRAQVLQAAASLADTLGLEEVSLATLAAQLGIRTPTLYHYFAGLPGLRRELALLGLREVSIVLGQAVMGKAGDEAVSALSYALRSFAKAHPGLYAASSRAAAPDDVELAHAGAEVVEIALRALTSYHLPEDDALHAVRMIRSIVHGVVLLESAGGFGLPLDVDETFRRMVQMFLHELHMSRAVNVQTVENLKSL